MGMWVMKTTSSLSALKPTNEKTMRKILFLSVIFCTLYCCSDRVVHDNGENQDTVSVPQDRNDVEGLLTYIQKSHFEYMWSGAGVGSGLARVRYFPSDPSHDAGTITTGASGFGIMGIIVGIERGFISRSEGLERLGKIVSFLEKAERWHGMYPHWMDDSTGKTIAFAGSDGEDNGADIVETAFLASGLLCARQYLIDGPEDGHALAKRMDAIWKGMEWNWFAAEDGCLIWHWSPTVGFRKNMRIQGYNECLLPYVLAASSPDFALPEPKKSYEAGWCRGGVIVNPGERYGIPFVVKHNSGDNEVGPMFWTAFSYAGLCPEGLVDGSGIDYGAAVRNHALIQYNYCVENPKGWSCYGPDCWGMSAGYTSNETTDYQAMRTNNDKGVVTISAALAAMPYTPEQSIAAAKHYYWDIAGQAGPWGFWDSYSDKEGVVKRYLANNQCIVVPMIENYRTGLLWKLFMSSPDIRTGLDKLGFTYKNF